MQEVSLNLHRPWSTSWCYTEPMVRVVRVLDFNICCTMANHRFCVADLGSESFSKKSTQTQKIDKLKLAHIIIVV